MSRVTCRGQPAIELDAQGNFPAPPSDEKKPEGKPPKPAKAAAPKPESGAKGEEDKGDANPEEDDDELVKRPWSKDEDEIVIELVQRFGPKKWSQIAAQLPGRIGKQCRERCLGRFDSLNLCIEHAHVDRMDESCHQVAQPSDSRHQKGSMDL